PVWPHDNSIAVAGLRRYRHAEAAGQVIDGIMEAGVRMPNHRLPELFCGFRRDTRYNNGPAEYLVSCNPQAWGAGAAFHLMQTALGIVPDATAGRLYLNPIPFGQARSVEIHGMRIGSGNLSFTLAYNGGRPPVTVITQPDRRGGIPRDAVRGGHGVARPRRLLIGVRHPACRHRPAPVDRAGRARRPGRPQRADAPLQPGPYRGALDPRRFNQRPHDFVGTRHQLAESDLPAMAARGRPMGPPPPPPPADHSDLRLHPATRGMARAHR